MSLEEINQKRQDILEWRDDTLPISRIFNDPYYSFVDGLEETHHVFLQGNDLAVRFFAQSQFHIAELGFGTGLNFLAAWDLFSQNTTNDQKLIFSSFELYPLPRQDMQKALSQWPSLASVSEQLLAVWPDRFTQTKWIYEFGNIRLCLYIGDAQREINHLSPGVDAWFLDGFSPAKNPDLWTEALFANVYEKSREGGSFATYSAAGWVRQRLSDVGFTVERKPGFGRKKHMSVGVKAT